MNRPSTPVDGVGRALLIFVAALIPRAYAVGDFVTVNEVVHWFDRARTFLNAISRGDFAATAITGHPGVTTMWLGALGELLARRLGVRDALASSSCCGCQ